MVAYTYVSDIFKLFFEKRDNRHREMNVYLYYINIYFNQKKSLTFSISLFVFLVDQDKRYKLK